MGPIELFSGCRSRRPRRTEPLRETSGLDLLSTLATGAITANKGLEYNTIRVETNTKVCGHLISATARALSGEWKTKS